MDLLTVPRTDTSLGRRRFSVAGPRVWIGIGYHTSCVNAIYFRALSHISRHTTSAATSGDRSLVRRGTGPKGHWSEGSLVRKLYSRTFRGGRIQPCIPFHTPSRRPIFSLPGSADFAMTRSCSVDRDSGNVTTDLLKPKSTVQQESNLT